MYKCNVCGNEYSTSSALNGHKSAHKKGPRYDKRGRNRRSNSVFLCLFCGKENITKLSHYNKYCNNTCQMSWEYENLHRDLLGEGVYLLKTIGAMHRFLKEASGYKCANCGLDSWLGEKIILGIDHIDGNNKNNRSDNLRYLCPNCHRQTPTWGNKKRK